MGIHIFVYALLEPPRKTEKVKEKWSSFTAAPFLCKVSKVCVGGHVADGRKHIQGILTVKCARCKVTGTRFFVDFLEGNSQKGIVPLGIRRAGMFPALQFIFVVNHYPNAVFTSEKEYLHRIYCHGLRIAQCRHSDLQFL